MKVPLVFCAYVLAFCHVLSNAAYGALPVFPGAEGFGTNTAGGRGGAVCRVTTLADSGEGSFRSCIEAPGPQTVIFLTGGVIEAKSTLDISQPYKSIFGQTAPGEGIMFRGSAGFTGPLLRISTHDVVVQHLRLRAGASTDLSCCRDALSISNPEPGNVYNVVVDHSSISWGTDEVADIWYDSHDITISRNIISEGLNNSTNDQGLAGRGFIIGSEGSHSISFHHNFMPHLYQRAPLVKSIGVTDVVNNLVYHWVSRAAGVEAAYGDTRVNFVKNKFIAVKSRDKRQNSDKRWSDIAVNAMGNKLDIYLEDNYGYRRKYFFQSQSRLLGVGRKKYRESLDYIAEERHPAPPISETPIERLEFELIKDVGATLPVQDDTDSRLISELQNRTGKMPDCVAPDDPPSLKICENSLGGWPVLAGGKPLTDTDTDGIPDRWEIENDLDPENPEDANAIHTTGYSQLERWIHTLSLAPDLLQSD